MIDAARDAGPVTPLTTATRVKAILAGSAGNLIEWYDFYVYAFTALYFSAAFFPKSDHLAQIMATSGIFAVGFFMRPIGGWFFGRYADRRGRQASMVLSVLMMGGGSLLIAVLPTYAQVGVLAPLLLLIGRMVQGFSTGGEYGAAATYLSEIAGRKSRGFWSSFQYVTLVGGQVLATLVVLVLQRILPEAALSAYGWRIAFAIGAAAAVLVLIVRRHMPETSTSADRSGDAGSLKALVPHLRPFLIVMALTAGGSLSFYTFTTYMQKYLVLTVGLTKQAATGGMMAVLIVYMLLQPVMGALADRIGRRNNLIIFGALSTLCTVPIMLALAKAPSANLAFLLVLAGLAINSVYTAISGVFKAELFPVHVRALAVGLAYGLANAMFGGTAENVALAFKAAGHESHFYWYVTALCAVSLVAALLVPDTRKNNPLDEIRL